MANPVTPPFRGSYVTFFEPRSYKDEREKYSVMAIFPPDADLSGLREVCKLAAEAKFGANAKGIKTPFRKQSEKEGSGLGMEGYFLNLSCLDPPKVVDVDHNPITDKSVCYSGAWYRASVKPRCYDTNGNRGVALDLVNVQYLKGDEKFVADSKPEEDFAAPVSKDFGAEAPAASADAPSADEFI